MHRRLAIAVVALASVGLLSACGTAEPGSDEQRTADRSSVSTSAPAPTPETSTPAPVAAAPTATTAPAAPAPEPAAPAAPATAPVVETPAPAPVAAAPAPASVTYANCTEVKAAGAAPILAGQPGYSSKLDRDGDGVACES